jgi:hypothetical protein
MITGMVAMSSTHFGAGLPPREAIVDELTQASLHRFQHRDR